MPRTYYRFNLLCTAYSMLVQGASRTWGKERFWHTSILIVSVLPDTRGNNNYLEPKQEATQTNTTRRALSNIML